MLNPATEAGSAWGVIAIGLDTPEVAVDVRRDTRAREDEEACRLRAGRRSRKIGRAYEEGEGNGGAHGGGAVEPGIHSFNKVGRFDCCRAGWSLAPDHPVNSSDMRLKGQARAGCCGSGYGCSSEWCEALRELASAAGMCDIKSRAKSRNRRKNCVRQKESCAFYLQCAGVARGQARDSAASQLSRPHRLQICHRTLIGRRHSAAVRCAPDNPKRKCLRSRPLSTNDCGV